MKILHFIGIGKLPKDPEREAAGGLTRVALEVARLQTAHGHRVTVAAVGRTGWQVAWQGVSLVSLTPGTRLRIGQRKLDLSTLLPLFLLMARDRFDVIHSHEYNYLRYVPAAIRITHFHNDPYSDSSGSEIGLWEANECLAAARYSHAHVAVSRFIAERLRMRYGTIANTLPPGFDASRRIHVVHNGVDLALFDPERCFESRIQLRRSWSVGENDIVFLYSGAIAREKGLLELAHAFVKLSKATTRARLVLAGHATLWEDQQSRAGLKKEHSSYQHAVYQELVDLAARGRVIRLGLVPPEALPNVYAAADVIVAPSIVQEAFCLSAAEGLAMGKPLVASAVGGMLEFACEKNSVLVSPGNEEALFRGLCLLVEDDGLRARLGRAARRSINSYTWLRAARQLNELYEDLLAHRQSIVCAKPPAFYRL